MANKDHIIEEIYTLWVSGEKSHVANVLTEADDKIDELIFEIAKDIYRSCIKDYYAQYPEAGKTMVYDRHGDKRGFNLYSAARDFTINDYEIAVGNDELDASNLLPYKGRRGRQKRYHVLRGVIKGFRGSKGVPGFPMDFVTSYPNEYSIYDGYWRSSQHTIYDIFDEFEETIDDELDYIYWDYLEDNL